ncbi:MAG: DUF6350 family protein [Aurantimicrobium sp.]|nr:DUF6350 family protein [Aurantimicrobium sp.]
MAATFAAFEAVVVAAVGVAIPLIPLTILWVTTIDSGVQWDVYYRAAADIWLLGHGVHFTVTLDPALAASLNLPSIAAPFLLSLAPTAFALITFLMAMRLGRRTVEAEVRIIGPTSAIVAFALVSVAIAFSSLDSAVMPTLWRVFTLPTLIFIVGLVMGARGEMGRSGGRAENVKQRLTLWTRTLSPQVRAWFRASLVGGLGSVGILTSVAAVLTAVLFITRFPQVVALYEGLQAGAEGGAVVTLGQLAFLPSIVFWVVSWLSGAGFALGRGSWISPAGADIGPLPSLPIFGLVPEGQVAGGYLWLVVPVVATFVAARLVRSRLVANVYAQERGRWMLATAVGMAVVAGLVALVLSIATSGSVGPGRMSDFGPTPWVTTVWVLGGTFVVALIGLLTPGRSAVER